jgi:hypothetical protein
MKRVYILRATNIKLDFPVEFAIFTNKASAVKSYDALIEYLVWNHRLDGENINYVMLKPQGYLHKAIVDAAYTVSLTVQHTHSKPARYMQESVINNQ